MKTISLCDKITAYLAEYNIKFHPTDFVILENSGTEEVDYWNQSALGYCPSEDELLRCYLLQQSKIKRQGMVVTPFQAKAALLNAGFLDEVEAVINDPTTDPLVKLAWTNAIEYKRLSPMVSGIALALEWTEEQLDDLFTAAAQITA